ncbi:MAG: DUF2125 domain-containing protein [Marinibacterium sp.]|nr:DUF2125 domain-containing protein [Marinibacterium sp.]
MILALRRTSCAVLALSVLAPPALADVTPQQVWEEWRTYMTGVGYEVDVTETAQGNDLILSDLVLVQEVAEPASRTQITLPRVVLTDRGDGTVSVDLPDSIPVEISSSDGDMGIRTGVMLTQQGDQLVVSGTPEALVHDYSIDNVTLTMSDFESTGGGDIPDALALSMAIDTLAGRSTLERGDMRRSDQQMTADSLSYSMDLRDDDENTEVTLRGQIEDVTSTAKSVFPLTFDSADPSSFFQGRTDVTADFAFASGSSDVTVSGPDGGVAAQTASQGGSIRVGIGVQGLSYDLRQSQSTITAEIAGLPVPVDATLAESAFVLTAPLSASDSAQDLQLAVTFKDLMPGDVVWNMLDPAAILPREPATIEFDLTGTAMVDVDLYDPDLAEAPPETLPGSIETLDVQTLLISALGAELTGNGSFTKTDAAPAPGMPPLAGALDLKLVGGNALIDNLIKIGWIGQDEAIGARMMMGIFGAPGDAPDTLTSKLELGADGSISANGQRLR